MTVPVRQGSPEHVHPHATVQTDGPRVRRGVRRASAAPRMPFFPCREPPRQRAGCSPRPCGGRPRAGAGYAPAWCAFGSGREGSASASWRAGFLTKRMCLSEAKDFNSMVVLGAVAECTTPASAKSREPNCTTRTGGQYPEKKSPNHP